MSTATTTTTSQVAVDAQVVSAAHGSSHHWTITIAVAGAVVVSLGLGLVIAKKMLDRRHRMLRLRIRPPLCQLDDLEGV